jgi:hypothetical protein
MDYILAALGKGSGVLLVCCPLCKARVSQVEVLHSERHENKIHVHGYQCVSGHRVSAVLSEYPTFTHLNAIACL